MRLNIAISGGPCTGRSTLAAALFANLKEREYDYDLIIEERRKLIREFGSCRSPFERFYLWRQQEREELRSTAVDGFITDMPLFHFYVQGRQYATEPRDQLAVRELFRMSMDIDDRYQLIVMAEDPFEIRYRNDAARIIDAEHAHSRHALLRSFVEHYWPGRLFLVRGPNAERVGQVLAKILESKPKPDPPP